MPQTRMFRDRVVSMEQTLEGGEKSLELLKSLCREAFPEFDYKEHALDHERDLFVMLLEAPDGRRKSVGWTRMVLFDAERIPAIIGDPVSPLRTKLVAFLRSRASRPEILVTFRHLEEGWFDTPEPRREKRRARRGRSHPAGRPSAPPPAAGGAPKAKPAPRPDSTRPAAPSPAERRPEASLQRTAADGQRPPGGRRRRFRRRRRGRGGGGPPAGAPSGGA